MERLNPWKFGAVVSIAVGINYTLCMILWVSFTEPSIRFLNGLFHGLDFRKLVVDAPFSFSSFVYALVILMIATYVLGFIFANLRNWIAPYTKLQ